MADFSKKIEIRSENRKQFENWLIEQFSFKKSFDYTIQSVGIIQRFWLTETAASKVTDRDLANWALKQLSAADRYKRRAERAKKNAKYWQEIADKRHQELQELEKALNEQLTILRQEATRLKQRLIEERKQKVIYKGYFAAYKAMTEEIARRIKSGRRKASKYEAILKAGNDAMHRE